MEPFKFEASRFAAYMYKPELLLRASEFIACPMSARASWISLH